MHNAIKSFVAGLLSAGLLLTCSGCGNKLEEVVPNMTAPIITGGTTSPEPVELTALIAAPQYPETPQRPQPEDYDTDSSQFYQDERQWWQEQQNRPASPANAQDLAPFLKAAMAQFLKDGENGACAPLNIYFALAMLAQTAGGNSRQQILDALGHNSIDSLREQSNRLWLAHYYNDGQTTSLLANSVWLDEAYPFHRDTLDTLAAEYFASSFSGDLGTEEMDKQLTTWLNTQTGGLLTEYTQNIQLDPSTAFCLASTAFFRADWTDTFHKASTYPEVFHAEGQDITTDFMHTTFFEYDYYEGNDFSAVSLGLSGEHQMWLFLPEEGSSPSALLESGTYYDLLSSPETWQQQRKVTLNLSMPKFDVGNQQDLFSGLQTMGITDVFDTKTADFSPLSDDTLYLSSATHAARVAVDEDGVIAAAYTLLVLDGEGMPKQLENVDLNLNRPFLFVITGSDNLPLFAGTVNRPGD